MAASSTEGTGLGSAEGKGHGSERLVVRASNVDGANFPVFRVLEIGEAGSVDFTPTDRRTIAYFESAITEEITLDFDVSESRMGDELFVILKADGQVVNMPSDIFYVASCGEETASFITVNERWVLYFMYDGEKFVNTFDLC